MQSNPIIISYPKYFYTLGPSLSSERTLKIIYSFIVSSNISMKLVLLKWVHFIAKLYLRIDALYTVEKFPRKRVNI